jgi:hypothetical protein
MCSTEFTHWLVQKCTVCPGGESLRNGDALLSELTALRLNATTHVASLGPTPISSVLLRNPAPFFRSLPARVNVDVTPQAVCALFARTLHSLNLHA